MTANATTHKIGPWFATPTSGLYGHVSSHQTDVENDGGDIATTWCGAEAKTHAMLIAAAPDLLEVAKETLRLFRYNVDDAADAADFAAEVEIKLEAAIAKAEGRS